MKKLAKKIGPILERRVGYSLRCNHYCIDHPPEDMTKSMKRDLVEIFSGRPSSEWSGDECDDCKRTLGEVARGDAAVGATISTHGNGDEISVAITLCDIPRDLKRLRRLLYRVARFLVERAIRNGVHVTVSASSAIDRNTTAGYATRSITVELNGERVSERLRQRLGQKLGEWNVRSVEFEPPLAGVKE